MVKKQMELESVGQTVLSRWKSHAVSRYDLQEKLEKTPWYNVVKVFDLKKQIKYHWTAQRKYSSVLKMSGYFS